MEGHEGSGQHGPVVALGLVLPLVQVESLHLGVALHVEHSGHEFRKPLKKQQPKINNTVLLPSGQIGRTLAVELPTTVFTSDVKSKYYWLQFKGLKSICSIAMRCACKANCTV